MNFTKISITRPSLIVVIFTVLSLLGAYSYTLLNYELTPDISIPTVSINTVYPGASAAEIESSVTKKIEDAVSAIEKIDMISSKSAEGYSFVKIDFTNGADINESLEAVQRKVNKILNDLPEDCKTPSLGKIDLDALPIIKAGLTAQIENGKFYDLVKNRIQPLISQTNGVAKVNIIGGVEREIKVNVDKKKLESYALSLKDVKIAIDRANLEFPTGKIEEKDRQALIRFKGKINNLNSLKNIQIKRLNFNSYIKLKDVAEVEDSYKDIKLINRTNGTNSIGIEIQKQKDANAVELSKSVKHKFDELETIFKEIDLKFDIAQDTSTFTMEAADAVMHDLLIAIILVTAVCLLFLHSFRNAIIVFIAIPTSIICVFIGMYLLDFTLNLMTLLGLSLVVGILVDDAIVVIENIHRHLEMKKTSPQAAYDGRMEIGFTAISITLVDVVVFLPLSMVDGLVGDLFRQFGLVIVVSTLMSLFVSFTIVPLLASRFSKLETFKENGIIIKLINSFEKQVNHIANWIIGILNWSFKHKIVVIMLAGAMFFGSFLFLTKGVIGTSFLDAGDKGEFMIIVELPRDAKIEQTNQVVIQAENILNSYKEVLSIFSNVGTKGGGLVGQNSTAYYGLINIKLVKKNEREVSTDVFARMVKKKLDQSIIGAKFKTATVSLLGNVMEPIKIKIKSPQKKLLHNFSKKALAAVRSVEGIIEPSSSIEAGSPEVSISLDRDKMARYGLTVADVGSNLQIAFNGNNSNKFSQGDYEYDIHIKLDAFNRRNIEDIKNFHLTNKQSEVIKLSQIANFTETESPSFLERIDRMSAFTITAQIIGRSLGEISKEIETKLNEINNSGEIIVEMSGDTKKQKDSFKSLFIALIASIIFVYLIMAALYDSYITPLVVLFSIPLSIIGALLALALANQTLSIFSILGIIMLIGLVAKNAILVVDFTNQLCNEGKEVYSALKEATKLRFRPILMTNLSMVIGLLPIAFASGAGSEWKNGLAWALIGGLSSSMFLSLIIVPIIYVLFYRLRKKSAKIVIDSEFHE
jgi:HAE1 family hydrophobic/amphiphilic exporter-1